MPKINKTVCLDGEVVDYLEKRGEGISPYLNALVLDDMKKNSPRRIDVGKVVGEVIGELAGEDKRKAMHRRYMELDRVQRLAFEREATSKGHKYGSVAWVDAAMAAAQAKGALQ